MYDVERRLSEALRTRHACTEGDSRVRIHQQTIARLYVKGDLLVEYDWSEEELTFYKPTSKLAVSRLRAVMLTFGIPALIVSREGIMYLEDKYSDDRWALPAAAWRDQGDWYIGPEEK